MITRIEATRYRCFEKLDVELGEYRVLVGANGSGKTTLLDVPVLLGDLLRERTISAAFTEQRDGRAPRATALRELIFQGQGDYFILAVEAALPERVTSALLESMSEKVRVRKDQWPTHIRYELRLQVFNETELQVQNEYLFVFPEPHAPTRTTADTSAPRMHGELSPNRNWKFILTREYGGEAEYTPETVRRPRSTKSMVAPSQLAFPRAQFESQNDFPAARWFFDLLVEDTVFFDPDWNTLRVASPPGLSKTQVLGSGKNAPWLALELQRTDADRFALWKSHVHLALPQVSDVSVHEREDDHHAYFRVRYGDRYDVPSSGLSDGTLRILVLTLLAYIAKPPQFLVTEEPENGIHPKAIEAVIQGLASIYDSQVIVSSHSPVVLARSKLSQILAARIRNDGASEVIPGPQHPNLVDWKGEVSLSTLFAVGVLG
ncbi:MULTISPECIES: ATP-binding protein [unclassified Mesorhizobium]|uniref:methylation-associated defense system AAA family ATPase MAD3 n=1 Tax=unclassified Mesorhizobium TaxID=325217 RepID=UPI000FCACE88|nr:MULTISPECIES: ATP-binding protein [unclassified Mesorhizobium]RUV68328.1 ATPase [Mesorhizobium sp. M5C.F.Cr.IN.023.01.1.1]RWE94165.1 MAG: ATPase [Mesorhizobium sp.]RWJ06634.1 MAG: ATPase [Mesorhizobium sp.]RWJ11134.1 MAG: ATPase [Mesorhizobium sp.]RWJ61340.1 MAG: ATPase [Mesorhizobium sp.]